MTGDRTQGDEVDHVMNCFKARLGAALLAAGLSACGGDVVRPVIKPQTSAAFSVVPQPGVTATLGIPDQVSSGAALIEGEVSLVNQTGEIQELTVPRPCDVRDWLIRDQKGEPVMAKNAIDCPDQPATKALAPDSVLRERIALYLLPRILQSGRHYLVEYRFWGQPAQAEFTAR